MFAPAEFVKKATEVPGQLTKTSAAFLELYDFATVAARLALAHGLTRDEVAGTLMSLAHGIRNPGEVAESMEPLELDTGW